MNLNSVTRRILVGALLVAAAERVAVNAQAPSKDIADTAVIDTVILSK